METNTNGPVLSVDTRKWLDAQEFERSCWVIDNQKNSWSRVVMKFLRALKNNPRHFLELLAYRDFYAGDDWNFWWKEKFDHYRLLPEHIGKALEVGSGPYTNVRLISKLKKIDEMHCLDPLMDLYRSFKLNWLAEMAKKGKIVTHQGKGEELTFPDGSFDLVVCNNVLDHVQDAGACLSEIRRVLKPGGYFVFGQDLSNEEDIERQRQKDKGFVGHPIKLDEKAIESLLGNAYDVQMKNILPREAGRRPKNHYGTYLFIGVKK